MLKLTYSNAGFQNFAGEDPQTIGCPGREEVKRKPGKGREAVGERGRKGTGNGREEREKGGREEWGREVLPQTKNCHYTTAGRPLSSCHLTFYSCNHCRSNAADIYSIPMGMRSIVINPSVCASVCLSVCELCVSVRGHISGTTGPIFTKFCVQI